MRRKISIDDPNYDKDIYGYLDDITPKKIFTIQAIYHYTNVLTDFYVLSIIFLKGFIL